MFRVTLESLLKVCYRGLDEPRPNLARSKSLGRVEEIKDWLNPLSSKLPSRLPLLFFFLAFGPAILRSSVCFRRPAMCEVCRD